MREKAELQPKLQKLLKFCAEEVPFFKDLGLTKAARLEPLAVLSDLPTTSKQLMRQDPLRFVSREALRHPSNYQILHHALSDKSNLENEAPLDGWQGELIFFEKTSGSTGVPLKMIKSRRERILAGKSVWNLRRQIDGRVSPSNMFPFEHAPPNFSFPYDLADYTVENVRNVLAEIERCGYIWLHGHPQALEWWATVVLDNPKLRSLVSFRYIESNGSKLFPASRAKIERAFGCPVIDNYNCREVWTVAYECPQQRLHLNDELIFAEILDDRGIRITAPSIPGRLFVTSLYCLTMAFVRYELGDMVEYALGKCECGNQAPTISVLPGRLNGRIEGHATAFGSDLFSKVTRFVYDAYGFHYTQIRVSQLRPQTFNVYVSDFAGDPTTFAATFKRITEALLETVEVNLTFKYVTQDDPIFVSFPHDLFVNECRSTLAKTP